MEEIVRALKDRITIQNDLDKWPEVNRMKFSKNRYKSTPPWKKQSVAYMKNGK